MGVRTLGEGSVLWARGDAADCIAVVEQGRLGIRTERGIVGIAPAGTVVGEAAILALGGAAARRTADVVALAEPTVVSEYAANLVREAFGVGTPRLILRTLLGQICRNGLLVVAANPGREAVDSALTGTLMALAGSERRFGAIGTWDDFMATFHVLYSLREATDAMRAKLAPPAAVDGAVVQRALRMLGALGLDRGGIESLQEFILAEERRQASA